MPLLMSGHTQMPAYGIAEKAAEYIMQHNNHKSAGNYKGKPNFQQGARL
jgi:hypothetical protein